MDRWTATKLRNFYKCIELKGDNAKKYNAKYAYTSLENYKELYNKILEEAKEIILNIEDFKRYLEIKGMKIEGVTIKNKNTLAIRFYISNENSFDIVPLDDDFREVIYFDNGRTTDEVEIIHLKDAIKRIRRFIREVDCIGYFDKYDNNTIYYLEALKKYNDSELRSIYNIANDVVGNLVYADMLLEKIDLGKVKSKKILSNIYYLKEQICLKMSIFTGVKTVKDINDYWYKSIEYNPHNVNTLSGQSGTLIANLVSTSEDDISMLDYIMNEINKDIITVKNYEYDDLEPKICEFVNETNLEAIKGKLKDTDKLKLRLKIIDLYEILLNRIEENEDNEKIINLNKKILEILNEGIGKIKENNELEEDKREEVDDFKYIDKYKTIADALYLSGNYKNALEYYKKIMENINKIDKNIKKEIYEKLINSYIKQGDYEKATEEYRKAIKYFKNDKIFKTLGKIINKQ